MLLPVNLPLPTKIVTKTLEPINVVAQFGVDADPAVVDEHVRSHRREHGDDVAMGEAAVRAQARRPQIMADAAHAVATRSAAGCTGHFYTDEEILAEEGVDDFTGYRLAAGDEDLTPNFYLPNVPLPKIRTPKP